MLQRTSLLEKRKKKKAELDKNLGIVKILVERDLKVQNKKSDDDYVEFDRLNPQTTKFVVSEELKNLLL
jgi:hypothetical protein